MADTVLSHIDHPNIPAVSGTRVFVATIFLAWLALVLVLGARGAFVAQPGAPPLALLLGLVVPLGLFLVGYWTSPSLRHFLLSPDLRFILAIQPSRWPRSRF